MRSGGAGQQAVDIVDGLADGPSAHGRRTLHEACSRALRAPRRGSLTQREHNQSRSVAPIDEGREAPHGGVLLGNVAGVTHNLAM